ncbi:ISNCY family transposase (plasmid) [Azospirillum sp. A26]|uniref:ISNCY family transposase n=1 Tax=Azospirillum sp. A26 TaxID=3160607 RepID=UPI003670B199
MLTPVSQETGPPRNPVRFNEVRERALELVRSRYGDFGPTLAAEMLREKHGLTVSRETLCQWMAEAGLWLSRRQRRQFHPPRLRRERFGELIQIDGSEHRWFEDRADPCTLLAFIDDATGRLMQLRFARSESAFSYFEALEGYLNAHGRPLAFYSDKYSVFRVSQREAKGGQGMTQFGRALAELNIEILCANFSQAKGRVERVNRTLQDRLVKELRLAGVTGIEAGNVFLPGFVERFNARFALPPARPDDLHRPLAIARDRLCQVLCWREQRHVGQQLTLSYERKLIMLEETELTRGLVGQYVDTYAFADGRLEVRWKGVALSYRAFDKDQRVSQADVVENKRLSAVLAQVKEMQESQPPPRVKTNSKKNGYHKTGRRKRQGGPSDSACAAD